MTNAAFPAEARDSLGTERLRRLVLVLLALLLLLAILAIVGGAIWLLVRGNRLLGRTYPLSVRFANARGVEAGDAVEMAGVRIGAVEAVSVEGAGARVALRIRDSARIPLGSRFVALPDLLSTPGSIRIVPEATASETIPPRANGLTGESGEDLTEAFARLNALTGEWREVGRQSTRLLSEASRTTRALRAVAQNDETRRELRRTLAGVRTTAENGARMTAQLSSLIDETDRLARASRPQITAILSDAGKTTAATSRIAARGSAVLLSPATGKKAAAMAADVSATLGSLRALAHKTDALAGSAQALAGDPAVAGDVKQVLHNLNTLTETSNRLLGLLAQAAAKK